MIRTSKAIATSVKVNEDRVKASYKLEFKGLFKLEEIFYIDY